MNKSPLLPPPLLTRSVASERRARLVRLVETFPEASVVPSSGAHLSLEVRGKRFGWYLEDHHNDGRLALNCKASPGKNKNLAADSPGKFHVPKYLGHHGWVGLWLDLPNVDWDEVLSVLDEAYRLTAPKQLVSKLPTRHDRT